MKKIVTSTLLAGVILATQVEASEIVYQGTSVGGQAGIFGIGANLKGKFTDTLGAKIAFDNFTYNDIEIVDDEVTYNFDIKTQDFLATLDWHPYASSFKTSAGVIVNNSNLEGTISPTTETTFTFNGVSYSTNDIAKVDVSSEFDPVAPYVGIGWDTSWGKKSGWGFTFDLGIIYQGSAKVDYSVKYKEVPKTGNAAVDAAAQQAREDLIREVNANLEVEKKSLQTELDNYEFLPYISIGINYKF
jgi:hypothetical protein